MHVEMVSVGKDSRARITVTNTADEPLAIEALIGRAEIAEDGATSFVGSDENFLVIPPQAIIPPGATQNFRVQWLGEPIIAASESYLLYFSQIPIKPPRSDRLVQLVFNIGVLINVAPPVGEPRLNVVSKGIVRDASGTRRPTVTVENSSNVHSLFPQSSILLEAAGWSQSIASGQLTETIGIGLVQPGHRRRFTLPVAVPDNVREFDARIELKPRR
ncbi:hypothetical protein APY04_2214 [Hyphomicrobium sulfonivorans]|uniref:Pili assembly chaperone N-terminal domain-containing protein n=2 Tax=Hyphomicrobium sulfonivorans TaxID=121290 RepID=A0A120CUV2_HYPSL|nr:hypothetical protein APY04_2214 [Hyphomicrobium sulfonivorans]